MRLKLKENKIIIVILLLALFLRLYFFTGVNFNDDMAYVSLANKIVEGQFEPHYYLYATRLLMVYPIAFFFLFGINDITASLYFLLASLSTILLTYFIGKELFSIRTGLIASFLLAILPLDIVYSTTVVPDIPVVFYLTLGIFLFIKGNKTSRMIYYLLSGIALGLAWFVKNAALVYCIFFIASYLSGIFLKKEGWLKRLKPYLLVASGLIIVLLLEGLMYLSLGQEFLTSFSVNKEVFSPEQQGMLNKFDYYPSQLFNLNKLGIYFHLTGFYFYFAILSMIITLLLKRKHAYILLIWLLPILFFIQFSSLRLTEYIPIPKLYRYLTLISVPMCLLIADFLANIRFKAYKIIKPAMLIFLVITSLFYVYNANLYLSKSIADTKLSAKFLAGLEDKPIYADETTLLYYDFLFGYKKTPLLRKLDDVKSIDELRDSYLVVNSNRGYVELSNLRSKLPSFIFTPDKDWQVLYVVTESDIDIYKSYNTTIYYIP